VKPNRPHEDDSGCYTEAYPDVIGLFHGHPIHTAGCTCAGGFLNLSLAAAYLLQPDLRK